MVKKTVTFNDFDGNSVTKDFFFNLTKMEFRNIDKKIPGGLENMLNEIRREKNAEGFVDFLDMLILESYGEKSEDGRFVKFDPYGHRVSDYFKVTEAWDVLFLNLINNPNELEEFLLGVVPKDASEAAKKAAENGELTRLPEA